VTERPLRSKDVLPEVVVHPVRECLPHTVSCDLAAQVPGVNDILEYPVILNAADRPRTLPASEDKLIGGERPLLRLVIDPRSERGLCPGMKFHRPAFDLAFAISAAINDRIRDASALNDVPDLQLKNGRDSFTGITTEGEDGAVSKCKRTSKGRRYLIGFLIRKRPASLHNFPLSSNPELIPASISIYIGDSW